ncbi:hypothetical protein KC19_5G063700 [Ceratodon purpureus]|uniref:Uncharacterized protein n=1 Tax=Ceratodon purpureus TaxID=3225 RepID=A0A8T0HYG3_CERPU|nr:hypothetical protein KC19_5G063700 [Ceratodon purpureus]
MCCGGGVHPTPWHQHRIVWGDLVLIVPLWGCGMVGRDVLSYKLLFCDGVMGPCTCSMWCCGHVWGLFSFVFFGEWEFHCWGLFQDSGLWVVATYLLDGSGLTPLCWLNV